MFNNPNLSNMKTFLLTFFSAGSLFFNTAISQSVFSREGVTVPTLEINLYAKAINGSMFLADGILQNFNNNFSATVDNMDVRKFMNATDNLAIKNGNYNLIVERRPNICIADTLQLMLTGTRIAPYRFEIDPSVLNYPNVKAFFIDKFLRTETSVSFTSVTSIGFDITTDHLSSAANRFMIIYRMQDPVRFISLTVHRNTDKSITTIYKTENENNVNNYILERSLDGIDFETVSSQTPTANNFGNPYYNYVDAHANESILWYRVKANLISGMPVYSLTSKVDLAKQSKQSNNSVFPNPIINGKINLIFENKPAGFYKMSIVNSNGQILYKETLNVQSAFFSKTIYKPGLHSGIYRLIIENEQNQKSISALLVQ